ncbi:MAG: DUF6428 family protein [Aestuariivirga sp.]
MLSSDKIKMEPVILNDSNELTLDGLLEWLAPHKDRPLVFSYDGQAVKAGYHVTEVKAGRFEAIDCGANPESWTELFIQLWDVNGDGPHMSAGKFSAILRKVSERISLDPTAKLTFEVSDGSRPMQLHIAITPRLTASGIEVQLKPRAASCKPLDRAFAVEKKANACCGTQSSGACCG